MGQLRQPDNWQALSSGPRGMDGPPPVAVGYQVSTYVLVCQVGGRRGSRARPAGKRGFGGLRRRFRLTPPFPGPDVCVLPGRGNRLKPRFLRRTCDGTPPACPGGQAREAFAPWLGHWGAHGTRELATVSTPRGAWEPPSGCLSWRPGSHLCARGRSGASTGRSVRWVPS
jgi:hypothetical protein